MCTVIFLTKRRQATKYGRQIDVKQVCQANQERLANSYECIFGTCVCAFCARF